MKRAFRFKKSVEKWLKSLKRKEIRHYTIDLRPYGESKRVAIGKADPTFTAIHFNNTQFGALILDRMYAEPVSIIGDYELWLVPKENARRFRAWNDSQIEKLDVSTWKAKIKSIAGGTTSIKHNPTESDATKDDIIKKQAEEIRQLKDKIQKRDATNVEMTLDGFLKPPFPMKNVVTLHWGADRLFMYIENGKLRLEFVEANHTTMDRTPDRTQNQRRVQELIDSNLLDIRYWHYYQSKYGQPRWELLSSW